MLRTLLLFQENLQIHTITRHMRCEQIGKRRDTSVDIMAYRGRPNIGLPIMRCIIQPIIKSSRRMKRKVAIFICIVLLGSSCYEPGERGLFLNNKSGYELTCFVADEINSAYSVSTEGLFSANVNIYNQTVTITGRVVNGVPKVGTMYIVR